MSEKSSISSSEVGHGLSIATFLASTSLFFSGILMAKIDDISSTIKIPIMLLFACVISLTFAAIVYANVTGEVERGDSKRALEYMQTGNALSEYLGLNTFIAALPLVIIAVTGDDMIRFSACVFSIGGLFIYTASKMSLTNRALGIHRYAYAIISMLLLIAMAVAQISGNLLFGWLSALYLLQNVLMAIFTRRRL